MSSEPDKPTGNWRAYAVIGIVLVVVVALPFVLIGEQIESLFVGGKAVAVLQAYGSYAWAIAIGLLVADIAFPIPTTSVMAALGMIYGPFMGGLFAVLGSMTSGLVGYGLCRIVGRPAAQWLSGEQGLARGDDLFRHFGGWLVAFSRWLPVLSEVVSCLAGLARMPFLPFLAALLCGSMPLGFVFAGLGYLGADYPMLTLLACAVLPLIFWFAARPWLSQTHVVAADKK